MTATFDIRPIVPDDTDGLLALWRETWSATYGSVLGAGAVAAMLAGLDRNGIAGMLPGRGERGFCLVSQEDVVGSVVMAERGKTAYLWGLYVRPDCQRCGVGSRLLLASVLGIEVATRVEVRVLSASVPAISFYRKHGFTEVGEEQTEISDMVVKPCLVMEATTERLLKGGARTCNGF